jgi:hypothetical protein
VEKILTSEEAMLRLRELATVPPVNVDGDNENTNDVVCSCMSISGERFEVFLGTCSPVVLQSLSLALTLAVGSSLFLAEKRRRVAFVKVMDEFGSAWLASKGYTAAGVADDLIKKMEEYVLTKDRAMKNLIKKQGGATYEGQVFSVIVSYHMVDAQGVHIDCVYPNHLGTMLLSRGPKTIMYPVHTEIGVEPGQMTCRQFARLVCDRLGKECKGLEDALTKACSQGGGASWWIRKFGYLLAPPVDRARSRRKLLHSNPFLGNQQPGYIGMMGSIPHCGPECFRSRAVMFSSFKKVGDEEEEYSGLTQEKPGTVLGHIVHELAPKASAQVLNVLVELFDDVIRRDASLGAFLAEESWQVSPSEKKKSEAFLRLQETWTKYSVSPDTKKSAAKKSAAKKSAAK